MVVWFAAPTLGQVVVCAILFFAALVAIVLGFCFTRARRASEELFKHDCL